LYFYYALILYNAWLLANLIMARRFSKIPMTRPIIQMQIVKTTFHMIIVASFGG
jgi:hypothetical protein